MKSNALNPLLISLKYWLIVISGTFWACSPQIAGNSLSLQADSIWVIHTDSQYKISSLPAQSNVSVKWSETTAQNRSLSVLAPDADAVTFTWVDEKSAVQRKIDRHPPYTPGIDWLGYIFPWRGTGVHELQVTPVNKQGKRLLSGQPISISLHHDPLQVSGFLLINAADNAILMHADSTETVSFLPGQRINWVAVTSPVEVGSVQFKLWKIDGRGKKLIQEKARNQPPFSLFPSLGEQYLGNELPAGTYRLMATPFAAKNARGNHGEAHSFTFQVHGKPLASE